jgi:glucose-1-phosphate thymidylyltransferase
VAQDPAAAALADVGAKAMIPIAAGRPFLDFAIQALLDAGIDDVCLIVPPGDSPVRDYYSSVSAKLTGARLSFAVQDQPRGTADAVAAGKDWAGEEPFLVLNSDNFYPPAALAQLAAAQPPALLAFVRDALVAHSNIPAERIARFAVLDVDDAGMLRRIVEKPADAAMFARDGKTSVSMTCWAFTREIFAACAAIAPDPARGEYELPSAVQYSIDALAARYAALPCAAGVLDLTGREDVQPLRELLTGYTVRLPVP